MRRARPHQGQVPVDWFGGPIHRAETADNFDIYLPNWVARHNKTIFGTLFIINQLFVLWCWLK